MPYTSEKPSIGFDPEYLRATIPGWGVDSDPATRPGVPKEQFVPRKAAGTSGNFPEEQIQKFPREKSTEHRILTPVFGTSSPPKGLSGMIRRLAYRRYSEARTAHWLLLMLADRVDVLESITTSALAGRPDNPIAEMGLAAELKGHPIESRFGQHRNDMKHLPVDVLIFGSKFLVVGVALFAVSRAVRRRAP